MKNILKKISQPIIYRRLFMAGLILFFVGLYFENIYLMIGAIIILALGKVGMRIEHRDKKNKEEIR